MLSNKAKYALKALIALASCGEDEVMQAPEIAQDQNVPKKFLDLILFELRAQGLVTSRRGKNGGYRLARPAESIMVGDIIRIVDGPLAPIPCASVTAYERCRDCRDVKTCEVRQLMREVRDAIAEILDHKSLADAASGNFSIEIKPRRSKPVSRKRA